MMRMFTRSPESYSKSWTRILSGYAKFYGDEISVGRIFTDPAVVQNIHGRFALTEMFKKEHSLDCSTT